MVELYAFILSLGFNVSYFVFSYAVIMFMLIVGCALVCIIECTYKGIIKAVLQIIIYSALGYLVGYWVSIHTMPITLEEKDMFYSLILPFLAVTNGVAFVMSGCGK